MKSALQRLTYTSGFELDDPCSRIQFTFVIIQLPMEPLSDVLALLKPRAYQLHGLDAGGDWSVRFPTPKGIKFSAVTKGSCWVWMDGETPIPLVEGDCFLLTSGRPFSLATDPAIPTVDYREALTTDSTHVARCQGGGECFLVSGLFVFSGDYVGALFGSLPPVVHVRGGSSEASVLRWALDLFAKEIRKDEPGGSLTAEHLAHIMLIQVLRLHLASPDAAGSGWLFALGDAQLSAAVSAMHADIRKRWTLEEMARIAGMSRSSFAEKFKKVVGRSPLEYLTRWRMHVAGDRLRTTEENISTIAYEVGYESEAAFSTAFKKLNGHSPRNHRDPLPAENLMLQSA
jgi:AraC-like DNA-binding protein